MSNRFFVALAILVLGFFLYAFSVIQDSNNAMLAQVASQQDKMMGMMQQKASRYHGQRLSPPVINAAPTMAAVNAADSAQVAALQNKIATLEARLAELETDAKPILNQIKAQQKMYEEQRKQMEEAMKKVHEIPIGSSVIRGNKNAPVTLVEFVDLQCPYCGKFHSVQQELLKAYPDKVRFIIKHYPLPMHPQAPGAAKAVLAAGLQGKYWEMVDAILKDNSSLSPEKFEALAKEIGLNVDRFKKDLQEKNAQFEKTIQEDMELAQKVGARGTPAFYLNGRMTMPDPDAMKKAIDEALSQKK